MIRFEHVSFTRGDRLILNDVSFTIQAQERVAIFGSSGQGKTTLLKLAIGLLCPDEGSILLEEKNIAEMSLQMLQATRRKFSLVFQQGALFDSLNVKENVAFYLREYGNFSEKEIDERVRELLGRVHLENIGHLMPEELSGGMKRRVAIARSLAASNPRMVLYDEPTGDLDPINASTVRQVILNLTDEHRGFVMVTHQVRDALLLAQRFMFLKNGTFLFDGESEQLLHAEQSDVAHFLQEAGMQDTSMAMSPVGSHDVLHAFTFDQKFQK